MALHEAINKRATASVEHSHATRRSMAWFWVICWVLTSFTGCSGCRKDSDEKLSREELERRARERREAITDENVLGLPTDSETKIFRGKAGHWHETQQLLKSNREDLQIVASNEVIRGSQPLKLPGTDFIGRYARRTSLPKGQSKTIDLQVFIPAVGSQSDDLSIGAPSSQLFLQSQLLSWPLMTPVLQDKWPISELKPYQYQLAVLSPQALSYEYLAALDAVRWRQSESATEEEIIRSYVVTLVRPENNAYRIPRSMLAMTSIAAMVWDDVATEDLTEDRKQAILDWVHWGGQLIISGPNSWSRLQNSFLSPYLPAETANSVELTDESFGELSSTWLARDESAPTESDPISIPAKTMAGLNFSLNERGTFLPGTGNLVAESQVGRGRIVVTGFSLREPVIYRWKYFGSFFSSGILRRWSRTFEKNIDFNELTHVWSTPHQSLVQDARMHSNIRILSRDLPLSSNVGTATDNRGPATEAEVAVLEQAEDMRFDEGLVLNAIDPTRDSDLESLHWGGGGAAWNDFSGVAVPVVQALRAAAGIELPSRKTILLLLAGYLIVLVPINWAVFKIMGRLEYAWIAAPVLAIIGVAVVTRVAQLDIGFARRTTEISVLEIHGDYPRGHLTQYVALYTSLSSDYAVDFPENASVALPLGVSLAGRRRAAADTREIRTNYGMIDGVRLEPLTVYSNSTEMLHAEQIVDLPGVVDLGSNVQGQFRIRNSLGFDLQAAMVVRCLDDGATEYAWLGSVANSESMDLVYQPFVASEALSNWNKNPDTQVEMPEKASGSETGSEAVDSEAQTDSLASEESLWIGGVLFDLLRKTPLAPGQTRLFGYASTRIGSLQVEPSDGQYDSRCVVVAHLTPQNLAAPSPDAMIMSRGLGNLLYDEAGNLNPPGSRNGETEDGDSVVEEASGLEAAGNDTEEGDAQEAGVNGNEMEDGNEAGIGPDSEGTAT